MSSVKKGIFHKKSIKYVSILLILILLAISLGNGVRFYLPNYSITEEQKNDNTEYIATSGSTDVATSLFAKYACLMDADTGRILIGKNANTQVPMASTTKIMSLIIALEYGKLDAVCTTSAYAASMPDVQLNAKKEQQFVLDDLLYSLMLQSHNDSAVIIAENVAFQYICNVRAGTANDILNITDNATYDFVPTDNTDSTFIGKLSKEQSKLLVGVFTGLMNQKALELGCNNTHFITPNGLDAEENGKIHSTTPRDLSLIMAYCIKNQQFLKITTTPSHSFGQYTVNNANAFLNMYPNIISGKTGFTNDAGYCYICAYQDDGRTFIVSLLACGWPNNKTWKWSDTKELMQYGVDNFFYRSFSEEGIAFDESVLEAIPVRNGQTRVLGDTAYVDVKVTGRDGASTEPKETPGEQTGRLLLRSDEQIVVVYRVENILDAPVETGSEVGSIQYLVDGKVYYEERIVTSEAVGKITPGWCVEEILSRFFISK